MIAGFLCLGLFVLFLAIGSAFFVAVWALKWLRKEAGIQDPTAEVLDALRKKYVPGSPQK